MKDRNPKPEPKQKEASLPVHSLESNATPINILPLDHNNPYDFRTEHRHTYFEIMLIERGGGNQVVDFNTYPVYDNSCYIISPQQAHLMIRRGSSGTVVQFTEERISSTELLAALKWRSFKEKAAIVFEHRADLMGQFNALINLMKEGVFRNSIASKHTLTHLLHALVSLVIENCMHSDKSILDENKKLLTDFYQLVEAHYFDNLGVKDYVQKLSTTEKKLSAVTRKYVGLSPLHVIHNRVLLEAKRILLFEKTSHKEIAFKLGFDSPASFSAFIKTKTGLTPSELTKNLAEIHK